MAEKKSSTRATGSVAPDYGTLYVVFSMETTGGFEECARPLTALSRKDALRKAVRLLVRYLEGEGAVSADGRLLTSGFACADAYGSVKELYRSESNRFEFWSTDCSGIQVSIRAVRNPYRPDNG